MKTDKCIFEGSAGGSSMRVTRVYAGKIEIGMIVCATDSLLRRRVVGQMAGDLGNVGYYAIDGAIVPWQEGTVMVGTLS
jgi:hypothetical protein